MNDSIIDIVDSSRSLPELYDRVCAEVPDKTAMVFNDEHITYGQLREKTDALASAFLRLGMTDADRIGVILPTRPEFMYVWLAVSKIGASIVGLNFRYTQDEIQYMVNNSQASWLICIRNFNNTHYPEFLASFLSQMPSIQRTVYLDDGKSPADGNLDELLSGPVDQAALEGLKTQDTGESDNFIIYTSGTTGKPKGVVIKQKNILAMIRPWLKNLEFRDDDRMLCMLPLNHVGGGTITALTGLARGMTLVMMDVFNPVVMVENLQKYKITVMGGVPTIFEITFALVPDLAADMFPDLELVLWGGAPGTRETVRAMRERFGAEIMACYGASEVSGFCSYMSRGDSIDKELSLGRPPKEVEMKLVHPETKQDSAPGEIGEIAVRSKMVFDRYLGMPEATREAFSQDGWFYTGDLAQKDDDGFYHMAGRSKEMYICGGFNVYPKEIEDKLSDHPKVSTSAVIGMPHEKMGECGWAYVVPIPGSHLTEEELLHHCQKKMADYKVPAKFLMVDSIPISPVGKILKNQLKNGSHKDAGQIVKPPPIPV